MTIKIARVWAMPNSRTFDIKPVAELIDYYINSENAIVIVDPFANGEKFATITNDLDPQYDTTYHMDAYDFLKMLPDGIADMVLYDPPYSSRQVAESYKKFGMSVNMETTQGSYWRKQKEQISRITKKGGVAISFGWNSGGIGKKYGFSPLEYMLIAHGGAHNDTIVTVERKIDYGRIEEDKH